MREATPDAPGDRQRSPREPSVWSRVPLLSVILFAGVFLILLNLAAGGYLVQLDGQLSRFWDFHGAYSMPVADMFDKIGQRTVLLPLLFFVAYRLSRQLGSIRPLVVSVAGALALNFAVGVIKVLTARESPRTGGPELFVGNNLFPSGHTANIVMMLGLTVALVIRYGSPTPAAKIVMVVGVAVTFVFMTGLSIYRYTHWFTDLVAGGMVGLAVLDLCMRADAFWPTLRSWLKRLAGPAWPSVEATVARVRPVILRAEPGSAAEPKDKTARTELGGRTDSQEPSGAVPSDSAIGNGSLVSSATSAPSGRRVAADRSPDMSEPGAR